MYDSDMSTDSNEIKFLIDCEFNFQRISNEKWDAHTELLVHNRDPNIFHTPSEREKKSRFLFVICIYVKNKQKTINITATLMHQHRTKAGVNTSSCSDDDFAVESHAHTSARTLTHK